MTRIRRAQERHDDSHPTVGMGQDGLLPSSAGSGLFLRDDGTWQAAGAAGGAGGLVDYDTWWLKADSTGVLYGLEMSYSWSGFATGTTLRTVSCDPIETVPRCHATTNSAYMDPTYFPASMTHGFSVRMVFGPESWDGNGNVFVGLKPSGYGPGSTVDFSSTMACIGVGADTSDANWQWVAGETSGTPTLVDTGLAVTEGDLLVLDMITDGDEVNGTLYDVANGTSYTHNWTSGFPDSEADGTASDPLSMGPVIRQYAASGTTRFAMSYWLGTYGSYTPWL